MPERRFSVQIELKLYDFAVPEGYVFFSVPICIHESERERERERRREKT